MKTIKNSYLRYLRLAPQEKYYNCETKGNIHSHRLAPADHRFGYV
jgi:hypothetical protein